MSAALDVAADIYNIENNEDRFRVAHNLTSARFPYLEQAIYMKAKCENLLPDEIKVDESHHRQEEIEEKLVTAVWKKFNLCTVLPLG